MRSSLLICIAMSDISFGAVLTEVGRLYIPNSDLSGAESIAIVTESNQIFVADGYNIGLNVIDFGVSESDDLVNMSYVDTIFVSNQNFLDLGLDNITITDVTSVEYNSHTGYIIACLVPSDHAVGNGWIALVDPLELQISHLVELDGCFLPDHVISSYDGTLLVVSCEGEPDDNTIETPLYNPPGSVMLINVSSSNDPTLWSKYNVQFTDFNEGGSKHSQLPPDIYLPHSAASVAQNIEPEYSVCDEDNKYCYVTLQENNAVAVLDIAEKEIIAIYTLGARDFSQHGLDASDRDGVINIDTYENVFGLRMPDGIAYLQSEKGRQYILTANEGDSKDFDESRVADLALDASAFQANVTELQRPDVLGRLKVVNQLGIGYTLNGTNYYDRLFAFSSRDFTIFQISEKKQKPPTMKQVFSSEGQFEEITAEILGETGFNSDGFGPFDSRSDDKGPEPECIAVGLCKNGRVYVFIGLERTGGIIVYDATYIDEGKVTFVEYVNNRNWSVSIDAYTRPPDTAGDIGPEQVIFVHEDVYGVPLLMVASAESASVTMYRVECAPFDHSDSSSDSNEEDNNEGLRTDKQYDESSQQTAESNDNESNEMSLAVVISLASVGACLVIVAAIVVICYTKRWSHSHKLVSTAEKEPNTPMPKDVVVVTEAAVETDELESVAMVMIR